MAALGERPDILFYMRAAMLPLFAVVLLFTYRLALRLYSQRVALWSVVLLSLWPSFFLKSLEYRNDNAWNALWMIALVLFVSGPPSMRRWFIGGIVIGCAFAVSLKTLLLVITLAGAGMITRYVRRDKTPFGASLAAALGGVVIVPAIVASYFIAVGAWANLVYCVFTFNTLLQKTHPSNTLEHVLWPIAMAAIVLVARRYPQSDPRRMFCAIAFAVFAVTLVSFWLLISPRDMLPIMPLGVMFAVAAFDRFDDRVIVYAVAAVVLVISLFYYASRFQDRTQEFVTMMNQTLHLTRPGEPIMDLKGETIYRRRPFYFIFEFIAHEAIEKGLIADRVPEAVVAARCYVAQADGAQWPDRARKFLNDYFLDLGRLRAAGDWVDPDGTFSIAVPGRYIVIDDKGPVAGTIDGVVYGAPRDLTSGDHKFLGSKPSQRYAVLWAPAFERGFSPFHLKDRNFRYRDHQRHSRLFL
ncbi:MAG TPA: glycosyltransferase family 39 protein [Thermoanaerobaculia bacterium]